MGCCGLQVSKKGLVTFCRVRAVCTELSPVCVCGGGGGSLQDAGVGSGPSVSGNCVGCGMLGGRSTCSEVFPIGSYRNSSGGIW